MKLHFYIFTYNEKFILQFLLEHYKWVDLITFVDGQSNDGSEELISRYPNTEIIQIDTGGKIRDDKHNEVRNTIWKKDAGIYDYIAVLDADEFLFAKNPKRFFEVCKHIGYDIIRPTGYNMCSRTSPEPGKLITDQITDGVYSEMYSKPCILSPDITNIELTPGGHWYNETGSHKRLETNELKLLHYNLIGYEYVINKHELNCKRKSKEDLDKGWGWQHGISHAEYLVQFMFPTLYNAEPVL